MKVKAAVLYELGGRLEVEDIELANSKENEVLVKVSAAGVCHSDISVFDGVIPFPLPAVLGHEGSGAVLVCGQLANVLLTADGKYFMGTQVMDEARHTEFFQRYLGERVGKIYEQASAGKELFDYILSDPRWYIKTIGLQLVGETFAVALFKMLSETAKDELLRYGCKLILRGEARHMGFEMLSLPEQVKEMDAQEHQEGEEFTIYFLRNTLTGGFPKEAYLDMGFNKAEIAEIRELRKEKTQTAYFAMFRSLVKKEMHSTLVNNLHRCEVLSETMKTKLKQELRVNMVEHLSAD